MAQNIIVEPDVGEERDSTKPSDALVGWVMGFIPDWRAVRDGAYKDQWDDAYMTWRGRWRPENKTRKRERSRLISTGTMMAVDLTVAEIIEAILGRENFIDLPDDVADQQKQDMEQSRANLLEDLKRDGFIAFITETVLNGALYGTGIGKINIDVETQVQPQRQATDDGVSIVRVARETVKVYPSPVEPGQLVTDPNVADIDDMIGVAHEFSMPLHQIWKRQTNGTYMNNEVIGGDWLNHSTEERREEGRGQRQSTAFITEYHGLVPEKLLAKAMLEDEDEVGRTIIESKEEGRMVEAVVTIANQGTLLRAIPNPSIMEDRAILAYQHDSVPNRFWGRGVVEKAFHPQKAMDAEMRARVDALAWMNNPMLAVDLTALVPGQNANPYPGKLVGFKRDPKTALSDFSYGAMDAGTFQQTQELERQLQQATGALDSIASLRGNVRDETATGSAISASGFIKRSKRTMYNIEEFLTKLIRRILWRKMQYDPERYPLDAEFQVKGAVGMMAREIEQQFMVGLLQFTEQGTAPHLLILKHIFENSSAMNKAELAAAIDQMMQPPSQEEQAMAQAVKQAQAQAVVEEVRNTRADTALKLAQGDKAKAEALLKTIEAEFKDDEAMMDSLRLVLDRQEVQNQDRQMDIQDRKLDIDERRVAQQGRQQRSE